MNDNKKIVKIFMMPLQYPCGPQSACCGPIGQSEEEIMSLKQAIEKNTACIVKIINVTEGREMRNYLQILSLLRSFGYMALPIISLNDEIISMGKPSPEEAVLLIKEKIGG